MNLSGQISKSTTYYYHSLGYVQGETHEMCRKKKKHRWETLASVLKMGSHKFHMPFTASTCIQSS